MQSTTDTPFAPPRLNSTRKLPGWVDALGTWFLPSDPRAATAEPYFDWLLDTGSLTARLKARSAGNFEVELADQGWISIEDTALRSRFGPVVAEHEFWSRKVALKGAGFDWVFAHTLIPQHALRGELADILSLGTTPLGEWLFAQAALKRSPIELCRIGSNTWGRRSWFYLASKPVLVVEYFLPSLLGDSPSR